jgi:hypothetical protein
MLDRRPALAVLFATVALAACGGSSDAPAPPPAPSGPTLAQRTSAATATAQSTANLCNPIRPFYWEVGDGTQRHASGSVNAAGNATTFTGSSVMNIASASKWLYGAYVVERRAGALTADDIRHLNFTAGYTSFGFSGCEPGDTVASCVARGNNGVQTPAHVDRFSYGGGHMQVHANLAAPGMALGPLDNATLAAEMTRVLGMSLSYTQPQLAGGARTTPDNYAVFLRKLLNNELRLSPLLGAHAVCTNPATCPTAVNTPVPPSQSFDYSLGHWVETSGDGAFSSAGAFGFYPWIDVDKTHYGIVARVALAGGGNESADCGALIRRAWVTGVAQ